MKQSSMIKKIILILEFVKTATNFGSADTVSSDSSNKLVIDLSYKPNAPDSTVNMGSSHLQAINELINNLFNVPINQAIKEECVEAIDEAFQMYFKETGIYPLYSIDDSVLYSTLAGLDDKINKHSQPACLKSDQLAHRKKLYAAIIATFLVHLEKLHITSQEVEMSLAEKKQKISDLFDFLLSLIKKSVEAFKTGIKDINLYKANIERVSKKLDVLLKNTKTLAEQRKQNLLNKKRKIDEQRKQNLLNKKRKIDDRGEAVENPPTEFNDRGEAVENPPTEERKETSNNNATNQIEPLLKPLFSDQSIKDFLTESIKNYTMAIEQIENKFPSGLESLTPSQAHSFFKVFIGHNKKLAEHRKSILDRTKNFFGVGDSETLKTNSWLSHQKNLELIDKNQEFKKPSENKYLKLIFSYYYEVLTNGSDVHIYANNGIIGDILNIFYSLFELEDYAISEEFGKHIGILGNSLFYLEIIYSKFDNQKCENCTRKNTLFCDKCINYLYAELSDFINSEKNPRNLDSIIQKDPFLTNFRYELPEHLKAVYEVVLETVRSYPFLPLQCYFISQLVNLERKKIEVTEKVTSELSELAAFFFSSSLNTKFPKDYTLNLNDCPTTRQIVAMLLKGKKESKKDFKPEFYKKLKPLGIKDLRKTPPPKLSHK
ncbi:hypothetical protein GINT2_000881 [Glugoides intestinalis]